MCKMAVFFEQKLLQEKIDSLSQTDGAGIYSTAERFLLKGTKFDVADFMPVIEEDRLPVLIHARQVSSGAKKDRFVQPFRFGRIVFAHNGTISKAFLWPHLPHVREEFTKEAVQKNVDLSDSYLIAQILVGKSLNQIIEFLDTHSTWNNFIVFHEREQKWMIMGNFSIFKKENSENQLTGLVVNHAYPKVKGHLIATKTGRIVDQKVEEVVQTYANYWDRERPVYSGGAAYKPPVTQPITGQQGILPADDEAYTGKVWPGLAECM